jgi:mRNA interferase MazF
MPSYSKGEVILVRYPFSNLSGSKVRPAVVVNDSHVSQDVVIVPLTSKVSPLLVGEFVLADWKAAGLNVASAVKRGLYTVHQSLVIKAVGSLSATDAGILDNSLRSWLGLR